MHEARFVARLLFFSSSVWYAYAACSRRRPHWGLSREMCGKWKKLIFVHIFHTFFFLRKKCTFNVFGGFVVKMFLKAFLQTVFPRFAFTKISKFIEMHLVQCNRNIKMKIDRVHAPPTHQRYEFSEYIQNAIGPLKMSINWIRIYLWLWVFD